ncbi:hypothetical protein K469DRAFT_684255 [Zopfia rhizophila CBS 207.26]|uniref:Uncharacterized protein n=1 Tax=Zopfia rhizophila CBS 207.26 TaxID=1314779 RepID=A0A6A6EAV3_9PEZI|nr:hypothetical protein K469DRAFT_684255 [Zopfia rhizophila CBS 207.26]
MTLCQQKTSSPKTLPLRPNRRRKRCNRTGCLDEEPWIGTVGFESERDRVVCGLEDQIQQVSSEKRTFEVVRKELSKTQEKAEKAASKAKDKERHLVGLLGTIKARHEHDTESHKRRIGKIEEGLRRAYQNLDHIRGKSSRPRKPTSSNPVTTLKGHIQLLKKLSYAEDALPAANQRYKGRTKSFEGNTKRPRVSASS